MLYSQVFHIVGNAWNILSDREKASGTLDVSYKRQIVILINLSLLEVTSKVPEPFFSIHRGFFMQFLQHTVFHSLQEMFNYSYYRDRQTPCLLLKNGRKKFEGRVKFLLTLKKHTCEKKKHTCLITNKCYLLCCYIQVWVHVVYLI